MSESALDTLAAGAMARKAEKQSKLTPVGSEVGTSPEERGTIPVVPFPYDRPVEGVAASIAEARRAMKFIESQLVALEHTFGLVVAAIPENKWPDPIPTVTARPASGNFAAEYAAKSAAAQAATFASLDDSVSPAPVVPADQADWTCPVHPSGRQITLTSPRGVVYQKCAETSCFKSARH